ncbi:MAG: hypothetical protein ACPHL9_11755 [Limisphaerales bacterium]
MAKRTSDSGVLMKTNTSSIHSVLRRRRYRDFLFYSHLLNGTRLAR